MERAFLWQIIVSVFTIKLESPQANEQKQMRKQGWAQVEDIRKTEAEPTRRGPQRRLSFEEKANRKADKIFFETLEEHPHLFLCRQKRCLQDSISKPAGI